MKLKIGQSSNNIHNTDSILLIH